MTNVQHDEKCSERLYMPEQGFSQMVLFHGLARYKAGMHCIGSVSQGLCCPLHKESVPVLEERCREQASSDPAVHGPASKVNRYTFSCAWSQRCQKWPEPHFMRLLGEGYVGSYAVKAGWSESRKGTCSRGQPWSFWSPSLC